MGKSTPSRPTARFYQTTIDLTATEGFDVDVTATIDERTGIATWVFTTIDPTTGQTPVDPGIGLLPPDDANGDGEGFVSYTVLANQSAPTGTVVNAQATVAFDTQPPLNTPQIFNTLDTGAGLASSVAPLPAAEATPNFQISWSGTDAANSSAIAGFNVYVSDDGGPYTAWLQDTTLTSATFTGQPGHTYGFYSVATDNAGNVQTTPPLAQATTIVQPGVSPLPGDANLDGKVDIEDLTILLTNFGRSGMTWSQGNFAGDPTVDIEDLTILLSHFGLSMGAPSVSVGNAGAVAYVRGGPAAAVAPSLTVTDPESYWLSSATVAINGGPLDAGADLLAATTAGTNITASYNSTSGVLTLSGGDTLADYQKVLQSVTYVDTLATTATLGSRVLLFGVNDGRNTSASVTGTVAMVAPLPGDANLDGQVDIEDLTILLTNFGRSGATWSQGNFAGDATVDIEDLTILLTHFGLSIGAPSVSVDNTGPVTVTAGGAPVAVAPI